MKKLFTTLALSLSMGCAIAATPINRIVAIVNNGVITQTQLDKQANFFKYNLEQHHVKLPPKSVFEDQVLNQMINTEIQLQRAKKTGIRVSETEVNQAIYNIAKQNHKKTSQLYSDVEKAGLSRADFRKQIRDQIITHKLQQRDVASTIMVTPIEVQEYLRSNAGQALNKTEYHLENITVALPDSPTPQQINAAKERAELLVNQLNKGANFKTLAVSKSKGAKALKGGDLGWKRLLDLPSSFAAQVLKMKPGQVSNPIHTPDGFHILKLIGTRQESKSARKLDKKQLEEQVQEILFQQKIQQKLQNWVGQLRSSAYIKVMLNND